MMVSMRGLIGLVAVVLLRLIALVVAARAAYWTFFAMMFRFDSSDEFEWVKHEDVRLGGEFGLAFLLFFLPIQIKNPRVYLVILGGAVLIWVFVSGCLIAHHEWVHRVRSGL